ncbi:MAG: alkaline phosphatase family protein [Verrucomicrobiota bacterium]
MAFRMAYCRIPPLLLLVAASSSILFSGVFKGPAPPSGAFDNQRVLIIGIDGLRGDALRAAATPNIDRLIAKGVVTYDAIAGGYEGTETEQATISGPGWSTILTGVFANKHGAEDNLFFSTNYQNYPHFFQRLKESHPEAWLGSIVEWAGIDRSVVAASAPYFDYRSSPHLDEPVALEAVDILTNENPDVLFLHFIAPDGYGHTFGFNPEGDEYRFAIRVTDRLIGKVLDALEARPGVQDGSENWLTMLISDHGGMDVYHGTQSVFEKRIPFIVSGRDVPQGLEISPGPDQTAMVATALKHLGVPVDPEWGWEGEPFAVGPVFDTANFTHGYDPVTQSCSLHWRRAEGMPVELYRLSRNGEVVAELGPESNGFLDDWEGLLADELQVLYELETVVQGSGAGSVPLLTTRLERSAGVLEDQLVGYYPFESSYFDHSGSNHANHGSVGGGDPLFVPGRVGLGLYFDGEDDYLTLGEVEDYRFGAETDFTVGLWYKVNGGLPGFPVIIGNKSWRKYENPGFILLGNRGTGDDLSLQAGDGIHRLDPPTQDIGKDRWYFLVSTFDRDGDMTLHILNQADERRLGISMAEMGDFNSGLPLNLAQDGTGTYPRFTNMVCDEVMIWRRLLSPVEIRHIFEGAKAGFPLGELLHEPDADEDGLPDRWETVNFGHLNASALDDEDHDGAGHLMEWVFGTNPRNAGSVPGWPEIEGNESIEIGFTVRKDRGEVLLALESSFDLVNWRSAPSGTVGPDVREINSGFERHTYLLPPEVQAETRPRFYRLKVSF